MLPSGSTPLSLIADTPYAQRTQEFIGLVSILRSLGAQSLFDLPRIVVIGNQSAGKSSLVESIAGISLPRDAGTCTRCPMELRLARADAWSCQIQIRYEFNDAGTPLALEDVRELHFGPLLHDRIQVEPMLRRAQAAVLSPQLSFDHFLPDTDSSEDGTGKNKNRKNGRLGASPTQGFESLPFSRNVICVDVRGPELIDLSFVDLPGIVQNAEPEIVKLVEDLVTSYVQGTSVILLTLPVSGVLTKPDTLPSGASSSRAMWLDVLEGRRHALKHGYFCTRQPDDDARLAGMAPAAARDMEAAFFRTAAPWASASAAAKSRLGTPNLVRSVSELLTRLIQKKLPTFAREVAVHRAACADEIARLPPVVTADPPTHVLELVTTFCGAVSNRVEGSPVHAALVQRHNEAYISFKRAIRGTAPEFVPFERVGAPLGWSRVSSEDSDVEDNSSDGHDEDNDEERNALYLDDVRARIDACRTRELPDNTPPEVSRALIRDFQHTWEHHALACFERVHESFNSTLTILIDDTFSRFSALRVAVGDSVTTHLQRHAALATAHILTILAMERTVPYTQNTHYFAAKRDAYLAQYRDARQPLSASSGSDRLPDDGASDEVYGEEDGNNDEEVNRELLAMLARVGYANVTLADLARLAPADEHTAELATMAEVGAYFHVAYKRVVDYVPLAIDQHFLYSFAAGLQRALAEALELGVDGAGGRCAAYVAEDLEIVTARAELDARRKRLESVQRALSRFGVPCG
ncbi:P-loop containing nucleoside triphosphate hydrolase protein [Epithele typhae]|uniref:P-loop containing nucleoside triphosphate hydrolase protein n=1 Tax=Epithele typhae TaxID=378194 RepID=UPI0020085EA6|nr:P-loop containing nucleoside triphosphate hydrolase protein [Epithele typhae]KAH9915919.1 P-loop containing nucleoside triphosphate hydrolase protein [Epithele typhae]